MRLKIGNMEILIRPHKPFYIDVKELWHYRELFYTLALRKVKVRYKQTVIGILWAILQPLFMMVVFTIFFGKIAGIDTRGVPYPIFVYVGLLFWNYFSNSLNSAANSMISEGLLIQKVYFPRLIIPISATVVYILDFIFAAIIFIGLMFYYRFTPSLIGVALIIPCLFTTFLAFSGLGMFLGATNVKYRDVQYILPFFLQLLLFVTPVIYPTTILGRFEWLWYLNPMSGIIETMRNGLLSTGSIPWNFLGASFVASIIMFITGLLYFKKMEKGFADVI